MVLLLVLLAVVVVVVVAVVVVAAGFHHPVFLQPGNGGLVKEGKEVTFLSVFAGIAGILRETRPTLSCFFDFLVTKQTLSWGGVIISGQMEQ